MHSICARIVAAFAAGTLLALVRCHETYMYPRVEHGSGPSFRIFDNNSFIDRAVMGEHDDNALRCIADNNASSGINWFDEEGNVVGLLGDNNSTNVSFYTISENRSEISLKYRKGSSSRVGLFRCDVPDHHGTIKSLYIYIGTNTIGEGTLRSLEISYDVHPRCEMLKCLQTPGFVLTCRSEGGPATTVEWRSDGELVQEDSNHTTSQIILDPSRNAVYHNTLTVWGREGGEYSCRISNDIRIYFKDLTYLSHNTSSMTVKVAKEPLNLIPLWKTDTSLLINWNVPSVVPIGYVIFYKLAHDDNRQSVMVNGSKESHVLEGLRMDNMYNISMLSLSEHLPSALVGSPILSVADLVPSVFVSSSTLEPLAGIEYTLTCSVTLLHGVTAPPTIEWSGVDHGMIISGVNTSGFVSQLTLQSLVLDHGGVYVCTAYFSLNGVMSRRGTDQEELSIIIPEPLISVKIAANRQAYVGNDVTMECMVRLNPAIQPNEVSVDVRWLKDGQRYNEQSVTSHDMMSSTIFFDYLLESHGGEYTCEATLTPVPYVNSSPRITSKDFNLPAIVPSLIVITSPSLLRVLDMPPYNQFVLSCTVWAEVEGERVPLEISVDWIKRLSSGTEVEFMEVPAEDYMLTGSDDNEVYQSLLESSETSAEGSTSYRCRASIVRDIGGALKRKTSDAHIAVVGSVSPVLPTFVKIIDSSNDSVTIQWKVSTIAYTPETYFIEYGTAVDQLNMPSSKQESGPSIMVQDRVYSIELTGLQPWTTYYYRVVATNCDVHTVPNCGHNTASSVRKVKTIELLRIETSGVAQVGQPHGLSCIVTEGSGDLTWTDSSGWVHNSSNGSQSSLELAFPSLELSNVGLYTCRVTLANGDFREVTKEILAIVPPPNVSLEMVNSGPDELIYAGLNLTLQCDVVLDKLNVTYVTVSVAWLKNGENFITCSDLHQHSETSLQCLQDLISPLSYKTDNGSYSCQVTVTPRPMYQFLIPRIFMSDTIDLQVAIPLVTLSISSSTIRLLDVPPYNRFEGSCTVSVTVPGLRGEVGLIGSWQWTRQGVEESQFNNITHTSINSNESTSTLHHDEVIEGSVIYRCIYSLEGVDDISKNKEVTVSVVGIRAPIIPEGVNVTQISTSSAIIQWTVPSITYTPEMYVVEYGDAPDSLIYSGDPVTSRDDIVTANKDYSFQLKGLKPGTMYYFIIESQNSNLSSRTFPFFFYTKETAPGKVSFVHASRVNDTSLNISWGLAEPTNGNITHYIVCVNSSTDNHQRLVFIPTTREIIIAGLSHKTMYKVYVAAVNGAGQGEWQETDNVISTEGVGSSRSDGGGAGVTVGVVVTLIILLLLLVILVAFITIYLRRKGLGHKLIITGGLRSSKLFNYIMKDSTSELTLMKPRHPSPKNGSTCVVIESVEEGGKKTKEGLEEDNKTEGDKEMEEDEGNKELVEAKSEGSKADECKKDEKRESDDEDRVD